MYIFRLLRSGSPQAYRGLLLVTCLSGLSNVVLIALINHVAEQAERQAPAGLQLLLLYLCVFAFYYVADRASLRQANQFVQHRLSALRLRVVGKIRRADLRAIENLGHGELYATVAQEINHLSQSFPLLVNAAQGVFLLIFCLLYIATLSLVSFLAMAAFTIIGLYIFWLRRKVLAEAMEEVYACEAAMLESVSHFTEGFQEIRLNADKNDSLFRHFAGVLDRLEATVIGVGGKWVVLLQFANAFLYALVGLVVFILPMFFEGYSDTVYKIVAVSIFCVGPVTGLTAAAPIFSKADVGLGHVFRLERQLDSRLGAAARPVMVPEESRFRGFRTIVFEGVRFTYRGPDGTPGFTSGPWDFVLRHGEIVFLTGGNGSGKSTAMKLICGLYAPDDGRILVDGVPVEEENRQEYRELFSAIFPDFHLFDRLHGLEDVDPAAVNALIARMELSDKVRFENGRFSSTDLSTGQRKRLALIAALLEDREIYLFDEWAADQDAHFRDVFYNELLPELKQRGKAVLAVTHDDRYWGRCDRRLHLDLGKMTPVGDGAGGS